MNFMKDVCVEKIPDGYINAVAGMMSFTVAITLNILDFTFQDINAFLNKFIISKEEFNKTFHGENFPSTIAYFNRKEKYFINKELMFKYFKGEMWWILYMVLVFKKV